MPIPHKYLVDFTENNIYNVFNRTNNKEKLFLNDDNKLFFLKQYAKYINPIADTFCWCLLPNHFHFLIRIKTNEEIVKALQARVANLQKVGNPINNPISKTENKFLKNETTLSELVEFYFKSLFQSYSLAFNKANKRSGNLFYKPFKRIEINKESYFTQAIIYIHANPLKHNLVKDFTKYQWSSWQSIISDKPTLLYKQEVIEWLGGINQFIEVHKKQSEYYYNSGIAIEDD
jgi:REP element-mobilizing transposase RayT